MRITKNVFGTLEVDVDRGVIWINSFGRCVLRICQLKFLNVIDGFSSIDCSGTSTVMEKSNETVLEVNSSEFEKFLFDTAEVIYLNGLSENKEFLCKLLKIIKESSQK